MDDLGFDREQVTGKPAKPKTAKLIDIAAGRLSTLILGALALSLGIGSFAYLAGAIKLQLHSGSAVGLAIGDFAILLLLIMVLVARVTRVLLESRRGAAGARLHVKLVLLFGGVAAVPAILVAIFAGVFFSLGIQAWFNQRVRTALAESQQIAVGYLDAKKNSIRLDALAIANDLAQEGPLYFGNPQGIDNFLYAQTALHGLTQAVIFEGLTNRVLYEAGFPFDTAVDLPSETTIDAAGKGDVIVLESPHSTLERAVVQFQQTPPLMLMIERPIDPTILAHVQRAQRALTEYNRLEHHRAQFEIFFALIFATVALLVLSGAALIGLALATQIARPISYLIQAAERVRAGDLLVRVPEAETGDDIAGLSRAFNRMTGQLAAQRSELMDAYGQLDERRRFTETVLAGVSAGVIGLDSRFRIELPNRAASELLDLDLMGRIGAPLEDLLPQFATLLDAVRADPDSPATGEIEYGPPGGKRVLLVRIAADLKAEQAHGFVVTFDDVTALLTAQRKAAWADVARRIAHEIKNPLTPIQLSAERMKRRFAKEITSDRESFTQCADTIVRHVGDIGRMVDEFSAFARMPQPIFKSENLCRIAREALVLQKSARPQIEWSVECPETEVRVSCDQRLIGQAMTNLLQNAADAVAMRPPMSESCMPGKVTIEVTAGTRRARIRVIDNGIGLPPEARERLTEPYVTHKPKGTGLGLAIVRKIMEDHGGSIELSDRTDGPGAIVTLILPAGQESNG